MREREGEGRCRGSPDLFVSSSPRVEDRGREIEEDRTSSMEKRCCFGDVDTCLSIYLPANLTDVGNRTYEHFSIGHLHKHAKLRRGGVYETRGPCTTIAIELPVATACYRRRNFGEVAKEKVRTVPPLRFATYAIQRSIYKSFHVPRKRIVDESGETNDQ